MFIFSVLNVGVGIVILDFYYLLIYIYVLEIGDYSVVFFILDLFISYKCCFFFYNFWICLIFCCSVIREVGVFL